MRWVGLRCGVSLRWLVRLLVRLLGRASLRLLGLCESDLCVSGFRPSYLRGVADAVRVLAGALADVWVFDLEPKLEPDFALDWARELAFFPVVLGVAAFAAGLAFKLSVGRLVSVMGGLIGWQGVAKHHYIE